MKMITTVGLDLAKSVFQVHGIDAKGGIVVRKRLTRSRVLDFFSKLEPCRVGMEACGTAHHWAREIGALGHDVRLMPPQYVKPYVKTQKNDMADAEAICEAVSRPTMRFVPVKTVEQQSLMVMHGVRDQLISISTKLINAIRGNLAEFGIVGAKGRLGVEKIIEVLRDLDDTRIPELARRCLKPLVEELKRVRQELLKMDREVMKVHRANGLSKRLETIPGVGPVIATRVASEISGPSYFRSGRDFSAWIGLVPKQHSSGGRDRLGHITKTGHRQLRRLIVAGALSVIRRAKQLGFTRHPWLVRLLERKPTMIAAIALANKICRMIWALMRSGDQFKAEKLLAA